ncbi:transferase hexapeptide (six repeat-containing protein) [Nitrosospira sp. Nsp14]|jgi:acetyltransferase-like isoleucine patch superfamily enzyme|uniref:CatB-related O-acetyltransferase n=1 Tax=Nitrosospira sp. Nsp14 TaxID=1855333 RepID=UPI0008EDD0EE|nr:CatB-related O-acetyltransferase [Nitrosospira sp. Nsp14]SFH17876.1 transferase hexapeptide (six repeat-containing protein) [Nitrosospira sp. Nsp14]
MINGLTAILRHLYTRYKTLGKGRYLSYGKDLHIGKGTSLWAPKVLRIGNNVHIGKHVHIEANAEIGDYCLVANQVAIVGRHDHDFSAIGFPIRYTPWIGSERFPSRFSDEIAIIESDVWLGYGAIILTGVKIGKGAIVAAGSTVTRDVASYSIVAGSPARVIGKRFESMEAVAAHEMAIAKGRFRFSERGFDFCEIVPAYERSIQEPRTTKEQ